MRSLWPIFPCCILLEGVEISQGKCLRSSKERHCTGVGLCHRESWQYWTFVESKQFCVMVWYNGSLGHSVREKTNLDFLFCDRKGTVKVIRKGTLNADTFVDNNWISPGRTAVDSEDSAYKNKRIAFEVSYFHSFRLDATNFLCVFFLLGAGISKANLQLRGIHILTANLTGRREQPGFNVITKLVHDRGLDKQYLLNLSWSCLKMRIRWTLK